MILTKKQIVLLKKAGAGVDDLQGLSAIDDPTIDDPIVPCSFEKIDHLTKAEQLKMVKKDGFLIRNILNPFEEVQLEAVKEDGFSIAFIDNPSRAVKIEALKQNFHVIIYIK